MVSSYCAMAVRFACRSRNPVPSVPPAFDGVSRGPESKSHVTASEPASRWQLEQATQKFRVVGAQAELAL